MAKERDWVDYANLGSNLLQNAQLSGVRSRLDSLASAAEREQARTAQEDARREMVFQADTTLRGARRHAGDERQGVLAIVRFYLASFRECSLDSSCFRNFEDKERLRSVVEGFEALEGECAAALTQAELEEVDKCVAYMLEPNIERFVSKELRQELARVETEIAAAEKQKAKLSEASSSVPVMGILFVLAWLLIMVGPVLFLIGVSGGSEDTLSSGIWMTGIGFVGCLVFGALAFTGQPWLNEFSPKRRKAWEEAEARKRLAKEDAERRKAEAELKLPVIRRAVDEDRERARSERKAIFAKLLKRQWHEASG
jgi:hypothetical protein